MFFEVDHMVKIEHNNILVKQVMPN
jgi:hypothetical protein